jgi:hypothetical protein
MIKMGVLACLLWGKGKVFRGVVGDVVVLRSCVCVWSYVCVGVYRDKRGRKQVNIMQHMPHSACYAMMQCRVA